MSKRQNTLNQNPFIRGSSFEILIETLKSDKTKLPNAIGWKCGSVELASLPCVELAMPEAIG